LIKAPSRRLYDAGPVGTRELAELAELAEVQVAGWLGRLITRQVDCRANAAVPHRGRDRAVLRPGPRAAAADRSGLPRGVILGVHQSGKSSLLHELRSRIERTGRTVIGPLTLDSDRLDVLYEQTIDLLDPSLGSAATPASGPRRSAPSPSRVVLLYSCSTRSIAWCGATPQTGQVLGGALRALQQDHHADFYLAGTSTCAPRCVAMPARSQLSDEVVLTGLTRMRRGV